MGSTLFGWTLFLLVFCFTISEIRESPLRVGCWLVISGSVALIYTLSPRVLTRTKLRRSLTFGVYTTAVIGVAVLALIIVPHLGAGPLLLFGQKAFGSSIVWGWLLAVLMELGAITGPASLLLYECDVRRASRNA